MATHLISPASVNGCGDLGRRREAASVWPPPPPNLHLSADDLASYFMEKTEAFRRNPSPFHTHLPFFCIHTGLSSSSVSRSQSSAWFHRLPTFSGSSLHQSPLYPALPTSSFLLNNSPRHPSVSHYFLSLKHPLLPSATSVCPPSVPGFFQELST